jgi:nucleoside-diphosphate-sugar epimerase
MKILVTGGLGLIGHNVVHRLEKLGHEVVIVDTQTNYGIIPVDEVKYLITERSKKIKKSLAYKYDICDHRNIEWLFAGQKFDAVIHMASFPRQKVVNNDPVWGSRVMSEGLLNLLENSKRFEVKKFVYISSSMVYGDFTDDVTEDALCNPQGQYGIMKLAGEWLVKDYSRRNYFNHTIILVLYTVHLTLKIELLQSLCLQPCGEECLMLMEPEKPSTSPLLMTRQTV